MSEQKIQLDNRVMQSFYVEPSGDWEICIINLLKQVMDYAPRDQVNKAAKARIASWFYDRYSK